MDRVRNLVLGSAAAAYAVSDSPITGSEYNWNDLSIGNDSITCDRFFRKYLVPIIMSTLTTNHRSPPIDFITI